MKFSEEILEQFDIEPPVDHEPVNVMKIRDMLDFLREIVYYIEDLKIENEFLRRQTRQNVWR